jgi:hypothetical protein
LKKIRKIRKKNSQKKFCKLLQRTGPKLKKKCEECDSVVNQPQEEANLFLQCFNYFLFILCLLFINFIILDYNYLLLYFLIIIIVNEDGEEQKLLHKRKLILDTEFKINKNINNSINNSSNNINNNNNYSKIVGVVNKKNVLISLPLDVSKFFLSNWIEFKHIGILDTAFCDKNYRTGFLNILNGCIICRNFNKIKFYHYNRTDCFLKWLSTRNIYMNHLCINKWNEPFFQFFQNNQNNRNLFFKALSFFIGNDKSKNFNENTIHETFNSKKFKNLIELFFSEMFSYHIFTNDILIAISNNFLNLKSLHLDFCSEITDVGINAIA